VQRRRQLVAARVAEVAAEPAAPAWDEALPVEVALMPLAQRPDSVEVAELRAMHDGTRIAIRLRWPDPSRDDRAIGGAARRPDQCALQFSADQLPPLFGMGAHDAAVDIWHWSAFRDRELLGALDLLQGGRTDLVQDGAPGLLGPAGHADEIAAQGFGGPRALQERAFTVEPQHVDGHWQVVFVRPLAPAAGAPAASVRLTPGAIVQVSCAVWNGAADDVGPRKSISVWQELRLW
jgi:hypothetical protein